GRADGRVTDRSAPFRNRAGPVVRAPCRGPAERGRLVPGQSASGCVAPWSTRAGGPANFARGTAAPGANRPPRVANKRRHHRDGRPTRGGRRGGPGTGLPEGRGRVLPESPRRTGPPRRRRPEARRGPKRTSAEGVTA